MLISLKSLIKRRKKENRHELTPALSLPRNKKQEGAVLIGATKWEILDELEKIGKPTGFDALLLPEKEWLINMLFSFNPNHRFFTPPIEIQRLFTPEYSLFFVLKAISA